MKSPAKPSQKPKVSARDVAREAGVSLSTVSNALTGKDNISEETRTRVLEVVNRLGYRVSVVARALRMQRTFTLGVLLADISNMSSPDFLRGMEEVADRESCSLLVCNTDGQLKRQLAHMRTLIDRRVDGLLLLSQHCDDPEVREIFAGGTPYVLLQRRSTRHNDNYVGADNLEGITAAVQHLVDLGHRRIGFIRGPKESSTANERLEAYRVVAKRFELDLDAGLVVQGDHRIEGGHRAAKRFFAMKNRPTAILAANDMCAIGVINAAYETGIDIARDLSLIGMDDIAMSSLGPISLTTIAIDRKKMGATAATLLMQQIRDNDADARPNAQQIIFPMTLVVRGSTGPAKTR